MLMQILQDFEKITGYFYFFLKIYKLKNIFIAEFESQRNTHVTAEHVYISSGYLYAATARKFRVHCT